MKDRKVYCIGEAIYDIIIKGGKPMDAKVGGALLNTAVSLGRIGLPVHYIGDTGDDSIGLIMKDFLSKNGVGTEFFISYPGSRSRLAIAFIDDINHPNYVFYKLDSAIPPKLKIPEIKKDDIIIFGSFFGIKESIREEIKDFIKYAKENGAFIIYDPNFRANHLPLLDKVMPYINENIEFAHITKGSDDDFKLILKTDSMEETVSKLADLCPDTFIYTANKNGVWYQCQNEKGHFKSREIAPLSAIGAGDAFNAGLAYSVYKMEITANNYQEMLPLNIKEMIKISDEFAIDVCLSFDNYVGEDIILKYGLS
jgi:fructokinase